MKFLSLQTFLLTASLFIFQGSCDLNIVGPKGLKQWWDDNPQETITSVAAFGYIPWGRKILGNLKLAKPLDACNVIEQDEKEFLEHPIIVARRGQCPFVNKAHYAQLAGAKMLLIVDDAYENVQQHIMVNKAGQGESVKIPVALVSKKAGDKLIESLQKQDEEISTISVVYDFVMTKNNTVTYDVWLSSSTADSFKFVKQWRENEKKLNKRATFEPHYVSFSTSEDLSNCVCGGKYCAPDPDDERENTGADVILEDLRQLCLYKEFSKEDYLRYMSNYDSFCLRQGKMSECSNFILESIEVNQKAVNDCVKRSFDSGDSKFCKKNKYLDEERSKMEKDAVYLYPSVNINGFNYRGSLFPVQGVYEAICESFAVMPSICRKDLHTTSTVSHPATVPLLIGIAFCFVIFTLVAFFCYRRSLRREMHDKIRKDVTVMMQQYSALNAQNIHRELPEEL